jgi:hypothetical protein
MLDDDKDDRARALTRTDGRGPRCAPVAPKSTPRQIGFSRTRADRGTDWIPVVVRQTGAYQAPSRTAARRSNPSIRSTEQVLSFRAGGAPQAPAWAR